MKTKEIREKSADECLKLLSEKKKRISDIRFSSASGKDKNTKEAVGLRKDIARIKTILKETNQKDK